MLKKILLVRVVCVKTEEKKETIKTYTMKYLIGAVIGAVAMFGGHAFAANTSDMYLVDTISVSDGYGTGPIILKTYDKVTKVVCYTADRGPSGAGISCLKNY